MLEQLYMFFKQQTPSIHKANKFISLIPESFLLIYLNFVQLSISISQIMPQTDNILMKSFCKKKEKKYEHIEHKSI